MVLLGWTVDKEAARGEENAREDSEIIPGREGGGVGVEGEVTVRIT